MNKNTFKKEKLTKGEMRIYDFGQIKLHAYQTNDFIDNEVFIVERNGKAVLIESPCFFDNNQELEIYLKDKGLAVFGMLLAYHMAGGTFLPTAKKFSTQNAEEYGHRGGGKALINNFAGAFGEIFDQSIHTVTDYLQEGKTQIGGITFCIKQTADAFDVEIPEINVVYTHMLGHDCHSIVAGTGHADAIIGQLQEYLAQGYSFILTSHYTPEDLKDAQTKIAYLESLKKIAERCPNAEEFKAEMKKEYPSYIGENYLDMTADFFFA